MSKILKIEDAKIITEKGSKVTRYVFNDDKIVRVDTKTDKVLTKNVSQAHLNLISIYVTNVEIAEIKEKEALIEKDFEDKIEEIKSGKGAGLGVLLGLILHFTIVGGIIAGFCSFSFLRDISDKEYLEDTDTREINFRKGLYASAVFGWLIAIICCIQWKEDMISVLEGNPNRHSDNHHLCFKVWFWLSFLYIAFYFIFSLAVSINNSTNTNTTKTNYSSSYYR